MRIFDQIDPRNVDGRQWEMSILALTAISVLVVGMAVVTYPTTFSSGVIVGGTTKQTIFVGFCALSVLMVAYLLDRQIVISHLRQGLAAGHKRVVELRQEASADLLATLPGFNLFRDSLAMEHRRAASTQLPFSLLVVQLKPQFPDKGEIDTAFGDAAKALIRNLRAEDSIYHVCRGVFAIVLPGVDTQSAYRISTRFTQGLQAASESSTRFLFDLHAFGYPEDASTAREMEEAARCFFPTKCPAA